MKKPELLAPAGSLTKCKMAFRYGADAVYLGGEAYGLRVRAENFTSAEIAEAVEIAEAQGKSVYVTMNISTRNSDLEGMAEFARQCQSTGVHGLIVSDIGLFFLLRETVPGMPLHVSTQTNNLNVRTCQFWFEQGAARVNVARELSLAEIREISAHLSERQELEAFVHGAMWMSFSGRCLLSDHMAGRSSNRGDCAQPCRWKYHITEEQRPGEYYPVEENEQGTFLFNSKDLCMLPYLPDLLDSGIQSLKIEGRVKSEFYTAIVVRAYRIALDACFADPEGFRRNTALQDQLMSELESVSHRPYSTGFYFGERGQQIETTSSYIRNSDFIGVTAACRRIGDQRFEVSFPVREHFRVGEILEYVEPDAIYRFPVQELLDEDSKPMEVARHAMQNVRVVTPAAIENNTIIRRII